MSTQFATLETCPNCGNHIDLCACACPTCGMIETCSCAIGPGVATGG